MKPYTYLLHHKPTNTFYYGVRYAKGCHPNDFWKTYFTHSKIVPLYRTLFGDESFEFEIRKTFDSVNAARNWEQKVLIRMHVLQNPDKWLNRNNSKAILNEVASWTGKKRIALTESNLRNNPMKPGMKNSGQFGQGRKPTVWTDEMKQAQSNRMVGDNNPTRKYGPWNKSL
jgi:hypothetical protein